MLQREEEQSSQEENEAVEVIKLLQSTAHIEEEKHFDDTAITQHLQPEMPLSDNTITNSSISNKEVSPAKSKDMTDSKECTPAREHSSFGKK